MISTGFSANVGMPTFSIITPTYNRASMVGRSVESSLRFIEEAGVPGEIIVVDDGSSDRTAVDMREAFGKAIGAGIVRVHRYPRNLGVTGARQQGSELAKGEWLLFLDSDDRFLAGIGKKVIDVLQQCNAYPIVFFRCIDMRTRELIGPQMQAEWVFDLRKFLQLGTPGECLPAIRRAALLCQPYEKELRGFEGLTYARIIRRFGPAKISSVIAREYCTDQPDRLSSREAVRRRACRMARGYRMLLGEFACELGFRIAGVLARWWLYRMLCLAQRRAG